MSHKKTDLTQVLEGITDLIKMQQEHITQFEVHIERDSPAWWHDLASVPNSSSSKGEKK